MVEVPPAMIGLVVEEKQDVVALDWVDDQALWEVIELVVEALWGLRIWGETKMVLQGAELLVMKG